MCGNASLHVYRLLVLFELSSRSFSTSLTGCSASSLEAKSGLLQFPTRPGTFLCVPLALTKGPQAESPITCKAKQFQLRSPLDVRAGKRHHELSGIYELGGRLKFHPSNDREGEVLQPWGWWSSSLFIGKWNNCMACAVNRSTILQHELKELCPSSWCILIHHGPWCLMGAQEKFVAQKVNSWTQMVRETTEWDRWRRVVRAKVQDMVTLPRISYNGHRYGSAKRVEDTLYVLAEGWVDGGSKDEGMEEDLETRDLWIMCRDLQMLMSVAWAQREPVAERTPVGWSRHSGVTIFSFEFVLLHSLFDNVIYALGITFKVKKSIQLKYMSSSHTDSQTTRSLSGGYPRGNISFPIYSMHNVVFFFFFLLPSLPSFQQC